MVPEISVVLITCNRVSTALLAVTSLLAQQVDPCWPYDIVVVNDGSRDDTEQQMRALLQGAAVPSRILTTDGIGVPAARNLGARAAQGRWIACFDDDQVASPGWLNALRGAVERAGAKCIGGALALQFTDGSSPELGPRARKLLGEHLLPQSGPYPVGMLPASNNVLIERDLLLGIGGFDETFQQGGSDTDLFERVRAKGEPMWFAADALARHLIPPSRTRESYFRWVSMKVGASRARMLLKRHRRAQLVNAIARRCAVLLLRDGPAYVLGRLRGDAAARLDAHCSAWFTEGLARGSVAYSLPRFNFAQRYQRLLDFRQHNGERNDALTLADASPQVNARRIHRKRINLLQFFFREP